MTEPAVGYERRRHRRYDVEDVQGSLVLPFDVTVLNMSLTGLGIESRRRLRVGGHYHLKLTHGDERLELEVNVHWCRRERTEKLASGEVVDIYGAGLDFIDVLDDKARQVLAFLEHNVIVELERRIFGRFRINVDQPVELAVQHEFLVRKISCSGMLIETDLEPEVDSLFELEVRPDSGLELKTCGRVIHSRPSTERSGHYELGIAFCDQQPKTQLVLEKIIENLL